MNISKPGIVRHLVLAAAGMFSATLGRAQTPNQTTVVQPAPFQFDGKVFGNQDTIQAIQISVPDQNGVMHSWDLVEKYLALPDGTLAIAPGYPILTPTTASTTPTPTMTLTPGNYVNSDRTITLSGDPTQSSGFWGISTVSGNSLDTYPGNASFWAGPIATSPYAARAAKQGLPTAGVYYGIGGDENYVNNNWPTGGLISVSSDGKSLTILSWSKLVSGVVQDQPASAGPAGTITFRLVPPSTTAELRAAPSTPGANSKVVELFKATA